MPTPWKTSGLLPKCLKQMCLAEFERRLPFVPLSLVARARKESETRAQNWESVKGGVEGSCCAAAQIGQIFLVPQIELNTQNVSEVLGRMYNFVEKDCLFCVPILVQLQFTMHMEGKLRILLVPVTKQPVQGIS